MASNRMQKVNELFRREIGSIIQRDLGNPKIGFVTVSHIDISADLRHATVRVSVLGDERRRQTTLDELAKAAGYIQHLLGQRIKIRTMPRIQFKLDRSLDAVYRVEELLGTIHENEPSAPDVEADVNDTDDTDEGPGQ
jgi:ribosome-binding factor A